MAATGQIHGAPETDHASSSAWVAAPGTGITGCLSYTARPDPAGNERSERALVAAREDDVYPFGTTFLAALP